MFNISDFQNNEDSFYDNFVKVYLEFLNPNYLLRSIDSIAESTKLNIEQVMEVLEIGEKEGIIVSPDGVLYTIPCRLEYEQQEKSRREILALCNWEQENVRARIKQIKKDPAFIRQRMREKAHLN